MGIIKRQGIKQSVVNYLATFIGAVSVVFVYPHSEGMYSLAGYLVGAAALVAPFASVGANALTVRFFPTFNSEKDKHHGFLGIILGYASICLILFGIGFYFFEPFFLDLLQKTGFKADFIRQYRFHVYGVAIMVVWTNILTNYASNFGRIAIPAVFNSLLYKLALPVLVLLFIGNYLNEWNFSLGVVGYHLVGVIGLLVYVYSLGHLQLKPNLRFLTPDLLKQMGLFALFGLLGSFGSTLTFQIDRVMVPTLIDLKQADIYNIALFIGASIELPTKTIIAVTSPIIAKAWYDKELNKIKELYSKASINLFIIGLFLFLGIWISLDELFQLTRKYDTLIAGQYIVLLVGITKLFDMATSVNGQVIGYSQYYYFNLVAIVLLGLSNTYLNYYFIQTLEWGIIGPAVASLISITLFNLLRVGFIWVKFKMQPFSWKNLVAAAIAIAGFTIIQWVPGFASPVLEIAKNSILISIFYLLPVYYLKLSDDFNDLIDQAVQRVVSVLK